MSGEPKTVLVTGGSRGIGLGIAKAFAAAGFRVITSSTGPWTGTDFVPHAHLQADLGDNADLERLVGEARARSVDVLVNNAGYNQNFPFAEIDPALFRRIQDINVYAPFRLCQAVLPHMVERQWGRIVNLSSIWGMRSMEHRASYSTSKFAIDGMTAALAMEHGRNGILANCVAPGFVDTDMTRAKLTSDQITALTSQLAIKRLGAVPEIAAVVLWLGSDANTFITGQNIPVDGGYTRA